MEFGPVNRARFECAVWRAGVVDRLDAGL